MRTSKDTKINNKIELFMLKALGYIVLLLILYKTIIVFSQENLILVLYCILYGSGLFFSILLLLETYGFQFKIINRFCSNKSGSNGCSPVVLSKGATIIGEISWSDIGIVYFLSMYIISLLFSYESNNLALIISSFIAFPYTIFSVYYQWKIAKSWCRMCLMVQFILIVLSILSIIVLSGHNHTYKLTDLFSMTIVVLLTVTTYFSAKYILKTFISKKATVEQYRLFKFENLKHTLFLFEPLEPIEEVASVIYNKTAPDKITIIFRFDCTPCLYHLEEIIETIHAKMDIAIEFVFISWRTTLRKDLPMILHFTMLYLINPNKFLDELSQYISDYPQIDKYLSPTPEIDERAKTIIKSHVAWGAKNKINQTPTYLINNRMVNHHYKFNELVSILEANMIERKTNSLL